MKLIHHYNTGRSVASATQAPYSYNSESKYRNHCELERGTNSIFCMVKNIITQNLIGQSEKYKLGSIQRKLGSVKCQHFRYLLCGKNAN